MISFFFYSGKYCGNLIPIKIYEKGKGKNVYGHLIHTPLYSNWTRNNSFLWDSRLVVDNELPYAHRHELAHISLKILQINFKIYIDADILSSSFFFPFLKIS